jgi:predicted RNase H-like HicB family nuclease
MSESGVRDSVGFARPTTGFGVPNPEINERNQDGEPIMKKFLIIIEKHHDGHVAYPLGLKGVIVGEGDTYEAALADVKSAIRFHIETFGQEVLEEESPVIEAYLEETELASNV